MNTSRAGSNRPCSRIQRRRARATSARFCSAAYRVFFEADVAASEEPPHRAAAACDPAFAHRRDDLVQRRVRLVGNQTQQKLRVLLQRRDAAAAWLRRKAAGLLVPPHPDHHHAGADSIVFSRLAPRGTGLYVFNHSGTQVDGIGLRHRSLQKTNQCRQTRSLIKRWESFRFEPSEICSRSRGATTGQTLKMALASSIIEEAPQLPRPARVLQLPKGLGLDLADSFTRDRELNPNLLQGVVLVHTDAEAHAEDAFFAWRQ